MRDPQLNRYVYVIFDYTGTPRYVGMGKGKRWNDHQRIALNGGKSHKSNIIRKTLKILGDLPKIKIAENLSAKEAHKLETLFIVSIGRIPNGPLVNLTDGGEGIHNLSSEIQVIRNEKIRLANIGKTHTEATKQKLRIIKTGTKLGPLSEASKEKIRLSHIGKPVHNAEARRKIALAASKSHTGRIWINNGIIEQRIYGDIPVNFMKGRLLLHDNLGYFCKRDTE